ncbi:MAG: hypothetical protein IID39_03155 [Planctomycetes bacterium]|nr:hypothetical protein [Planctomycetota bacterium]
MGKWLTSTMVASCALWLCGAGDVNAQPAGQGTSPIISGSSPGANLRSFRDRQPGDWVQRGIANHILGPNIVEVGRPDIPVRQLILVDLFRNLFAQLGALTQFIPALFQPGEQVPLDASGGGVNNIVMTEIAHDGNVVFVELLSRSPIQFRLDGWRFADGIGVSPPLPVIELDRNAVLVVQLGGETQSPSADLLLGFRVQSIATGELALYDFSTVTDGSLPIDDPAFMMDYIQWDNRQRDLPLEVVAQSANLWTSIDFVNASLANSSFRLAAAAEGRERTSSRDILVVSFAENTLGIPESQSSPVDVELVDLNDPN